MLFGFAAVRRVFIKVMAVIGHCLRSRQTHIFMYLDDWLIKSQDHQSFFKQRELVLDVLNSLGLLMNWKIS